MNIDKSEPGFVTVTFRWAVTGNDCEDCGLPAPFTSIDRYGIGEHSMLCAVCAANAACDGEQITRNEVKP